MDTRHDKNPSTARHDNDLQSLLRLAGCRYWSASLLPALVGTTLPFWLRPPRFSFAVAGAIEFLIATLLFHSGFSLLYARFQERFVPGWSGSRLMLAAGVCVVTGCLLGLHLNSGLVFHPGVPGSIFIVYGLCTLFVGVLYVAPPFNFCRRAGGEIVLAAGLGLLPVLGAYLVQVGDITRRVYLAALPIVAATVLWAWLSELANRSTDENAGRETAVMKFSPRFGGRYVTLALAFLPYMTLVLAVIGRSSVDPLSLIALLSFGLALKIVRGSWNDYANEPKIVRIERNALFIHLVICSVISLSSLGNLFR